MIAMRFCVNSVWPRCIGGPRKLIIIEENSRTDAQLDQAGSPRPFPCEPILHPEQRQTTPARDGTPSVRARVAGPRPGQFLAVSTPAGYIIVSADGCVSHQVVSSIRALAARELAPVE